MVQSESWLFAFVAEKSFVLVSPKQPDARRLRVQNALRRIQWTLVVAVMMAMGLLTNGEIACSAPGRKTGRPSR
jgi:hypothetical protein